MVLCLPHPGNPANSPPESLAWDRRFGSTHRSGWFSQRAAPRAMEADPDDSALASLSLEDLAAGNEAAWRTAYLPLYQEIWKVLKARLLPAFGVDWDLMAGEIMPGLRDRHSESFAALRTFSDLLRQARIIAARRTVDAIRRVTRKKEDSLPDGWNELPDPSPTQNDGAERTEEFFALISKLPPPKPDLFADYFIGGLTYAEIAEARGMPLGTVCSHFSRGLKLLKSFLDPEAPDSDA